MAKEQTNQAEPKDNEPELKESSQSKNEPKPARVSRKIDMNTVEVEFDKADKGKKFQVYDAGALKAEGKFEADEEKQVVPLTDYLRKGVLHDFSVIVS